LAAGNENEQRHLLPDEWRAVTGSVFGALMVMQPRKSSQAWPPFSTWFSRSTGES
jgi:hypothetical protein